MHSCRAVQIHCDSSIIKLLVSLLGVYLIELVSELDDIVLLCQWMIRCRPATHAAALNHDGGVTLLAVTRNSVALLGGHFRLALFDFCNFSRCRVS